MCHDPWIAVVGSAKTNGPIQLQLLGSGTYRIEASRNLIDWTTVMEAVVLKDLRFIELNTGEFRQCYYRATQLKEPDFIAAWMPSIDSRRPAKDQGPILAPAGRNIYSHGITKPEAPSEPAPTLGGLFHGRNFPLVQRKNG